MGVYFHFKGLEENCHNGTIATGKITLQKNFNFLIFTFVFALPFELSIFYALDIGKQTKRGYLIYFLF